MCFFFLVVVVFVSPYTPQPISNFFCLALFPRDCITWLLCPVASGWVWPVAGTDITLDGKNKEKSVYIFSLSPSCPAMVLERATFLNGHNPLPQPISQKSLVLFPSPCLFWSRGDSDFPLLLVPKHLTISSSCVYPHSSQINPYSAISFLPRQEDDLKLGPGQCHFH